jgi:disulfide oxidoreductase YuzD
MITGTLMDKVVVVEANDAWNFASEVNSLMQQDDSFFIDSTHIDTYMYKAILVKREIVNECA